MGYSLPDDPLSKERVGKKTAEVMEVLGELTVLEALVVLESCAEALRKGLKA